MWIEERESFRLEFCTLIFAGLARVYDLIYASAGRKT